MGYSTARRRAATGVGALAGLLALALAACAEAPAPREAPPPELPRAGVALAEDGTALEVLVENLRPSDSVTVVRLLDPAGGARAAESLERGTRQSSLQSRPRVGIVGSTGGGVGVSLGFDLFSSRPAPTTAEGMTGVVRARIALADPADYRARPQAYRIEVIYRDAQGDERRLVFPAV